ncbi:MarR family winged helix-turn-helix transcriptional regulator [Streptococcus sobrinus]|uniref:Transcriptional regulator, MarR family n=1 Tax=Streptococcus sobrinus W1703 TaxID=1227275 RepID=U2KGW1_9STRE|nr:MarR family transcriptional regulator [Streptococcus sobrinus]AWN18499.1 MarR family transcriptional regulator [Streptococcus sobrinus]AWN62031.1 MarR family transcriptional regulator [Streptococcus sobrinus]AWN63904.1 MarR family transcriptional regulator [Streptococcus sobrinus]ERJ74053.1 transcriptional regulator, MarR family [Streptococcus sobrinus W1703]SQG20812.1 transcriptional regulator [Streptococcus sobrinus]
MILEDSWGYSLSKVAQKMDSQFAQQLEKIGLDYRDSRYYGVLLAIHTYPNLTQIKIGEQLNLDRTTIGQLIDQLEEKGFVARERNPKDRRQNILVLTSKGKKTVKEIWQEMRAVEMAVIANLSDSQRETFLAIAKAIRGK